MSLMTVSGIYGEAMENDICEATQNYRIDRWSHWWEHDRPINSCHDDDENGDDGDDDDGDDDETGYDDDEIENRDDDRNDDDDDDDDEYSIRLIDALRDWWW